MDMTVVADMQSGGVFPEQAASARPWATALLVGVWIPLFGILAGANYGSLLALAFAFAGAYAGMFLRRAVVHV